MRFWNEPQWFTVIGLVLDILGVVAIAAGVWLPKKQIREQERQSGTAHYGPPSSETVEKRLAFKDRLRQSRAAAWGTLLLLIGLGMQIYGGWPR